MDKEQALNELASVEDALAEREQATFDYFLGVSGFIPTDIYDLEQRRKELVSFLSD